MAVRPKQLTACSLFNIFRDHPQTFVAGITDGAKANGVLGIRECVFYFACKHESLFTREVYSGHLRKISA